MAIKFSQFVVQTDASTLSHIVGYNGVDNIQITPTNFLNSLLTGTAGQVLFYDTTGVTGDSGFYWDNTNKRLGIGTSSPSEKLDVVGEIRSSEGSDYTGISTSGGDTIFANVSSAANNIRIFNGGSEKMRITSAGNVGIGITNPTSKLEVDGDMGVTAGGVILLPDNSFLRFGNSGDATIYHDATDTYFKNFRGNLILQNNKDDADIVFQCDDGSGGLATYFYLDGSAGGSLPFTVFPDSSTLVFGTGYDLRQYHNGIDSYLDNYKGNLNIRNYKDDGDIIFQSDDGSGGVTTYFQLDGSDVETVFSKRAKFIDNARLNIGSSRDLVLFHNGTDSFIINETGNLKITQGADDKDMVFECDDGSGGTTEYFTLDGSRASGAYTYTTRPDGGVITFGDGLDLRLWHDPNTNKSYIRGYNNDLYIEAITADTDILFRADNGSGGLDTYFKLDGGSVLNIFYKDIFAGDNVKSLYGNNSDLQIYHDGTNSNIQNNTGNLTIRNDANDKDIEFACDDGSGGVTPYFRLDGSNTNMVASKTIIFNDNVKASFGNSEDLRISHNGTDSVIANETGNFYISQRSDDGSIIFESDDGSGGVATYFKIDGATRSLVVSAALGMYFNDGAAVRFGHGGDLIIYHDGSDSYISDTGTGDLIIEGSYLTLKANGSNSIVAHDNGTVYLYHSGSTKLATTSTGVRITGVSEYADNTAALAGGLVVGDVYRTGDDLKIVH